MYNLYICTSLLEKVVKNRRFLFTIADFLFERSQGGEEDIVLHFVYLKRIASVVYVQFCPCN